MSNSNVTRHNRIPRIAAAALGGLICCAVFADYWMAHPADTSFRYLGRDACIECHQPETQQFTDSHHDKAMDLATDETVLGDFNDVTFEHDGIVSRLYRDDGRFMIHTEGPSGEMQDFEIKYVFGFDPLQQYMVEFDRTADMKPDEIARVQVLRISWDTHKKRWFYLRPPDVSEKLEPNDPLHWTGIAQRWQTMCADCHSTDLKRNFDPAKNRYHTTFSEIDVSCEACHGPGSLHVELANSKSLFWDRIHGYGLARLKGKDPEPQLQTCAPCHSRRGLLDESFRPGNEYCNHYQLELMQPMTYHADGQIKDEVYVYGSFIQSKMYHKDIRCTDCHNPHSLELKHKGNEICTSCHQHAAGKYDVPSHHHHAPGTPGAMCVNCHMPHTTYMEVDPRRDHSLRIPRPDLSVKLGTPNACSHCHVRDQLEKLSDKVRDEFSNKEYSKWLLAADQGNDEISQAIKTTDKWCDEACENWYGDQRKKPYHFAEALVPYRRREEGALDKMLALVGRKDDVTPAIARATALRELAPHRASRVAEQADEILDDQREHPMVRAAATDVFIGVASTISRPKLVGLLDDESKLVRTSAARALLSSRAFDELSTREYAKLDEVLKEIKEGVMVTDDRAGAHMSWAMISAQMGRFDEAIEHYVTAIRIEPTVPGARTNLADLLERLAERGASSKTRSEYLQHAKQLRAEELPLLARDASLAPKIAVVQYRYGLALYLNGDMQKAKTQIEKAVQLEPANPEFRQFLQKLTQRLETSNSQQ